MSVMHVPPTVDPYHGWSVWSRTPTPHRPLPLSTSCKPLTAARPRLLRASVRTCLLVERRAVLRMSVILLRMSVMFNFFDCWSYSCNRGSCTPATIGYAPQPRGSECQSVGDVNHYWRDVVCMYVVLNDFVLPNISVSRSCRRFIYRITCGQALPTSCKYRWVGCT